MSFILLILLFKYLRLSFQYLQLSQPYSLQVSSNSRDGITTSESPIMTRKPRKSSILTHTDLEEDEDDYEDEEDDLRENLDKHNEGNYLK